MWTKYEVHQTTYHQDFVLRPSCVLEKVVVNQEGENQKIILKQDEINQPKSIKPKM
jgi:hypothetical protein